MPSLFQSPIKEEIEVNKESKIINDKFKKLKLNPDTISKFKAKLKLPETLKI